MEMKGEKGSMRRLISVALVAMCTVLMGVLLAACSGGGASSSPQQAEQPTSSAEEQSSSQEASASATVSSAVDASSSETGTSSSAVGGVSAKASVNDYSWEELSKISAEISVAGDEAGGIEVAKKYNLCNPDGTLDGTQLKDVTLASGMQAIVQIIGFNHDDKSDGSGKAGICFAFKTCVAERSMNSGNTNAGGWESSEMRTWLNSSFVAELPSDLSSIIVPVDKLTNNTGKTESTSSITATSDMIWLPSTQELFGNLDFYPSSLQANNDVMNGEGVQYKLYRDLPDSRSSLVRLFEGEGCSWWLRSPLPSQSYVFQQVGHNGSAAPNGNNASIPEGIAPCFCISASTVSNSVAETSTDQANSSNNVAGSVAIKTSVNDYSWQELATISAEISAAGDEMGGIEVAKKYNLCNPDGTLDGTQIKTVFSKDVSWSSQVQIVGFNHDDKSDGSGKAGISFIFKDCIEERGMNSSSSSNNGGWEASEMRTWLNSSFVADLSSDLSSIIVSVDKLTNNTGETSSTSSVTTTSDLIWLPSSKELCGDVEKFILPAHDDIFNSEGMEYKLYRDALVKPDDSNNILVKGFENLDSYAWWGRSPNPANSSCFLNVNRDGEPLLKDGTAYYLYGVVPGFCI